MNTEARFWEKVNKTSSCWLWTGAKSRGYGYFRWNGRNGRATRYSYLLLRGPIGEGLELDHLCRQKLCVNPHHLEAVSHKENVLRGIAPPALNARKTHCHLGHPLPKSRRCLRCNREINRRWRERERVVPHE